MAQVAEHSDPFWRKAAASEAGGCVEVALTDESVFVRDSKHPAEPVLQVSRSNWSAFLQALSHGELDTPGK